MMRRRQVLQAAAALSLLGGAARGASILGDVMIVAGGPPDGRIDRWSRAAAQALGASLTPQGVISTETVGGVDGVTAANRAQNLVVPNGRTATMLPGTTAIAFLTNDPRVQFQPDDFVPVLGGLNPLVFVVRGGLQRLSAPTPLRVAAASPASGDLAGLLAMARLGVPVAPVFGLNGVRAKTRAFADGEADAMLLFGEGVIEDAAPLTAQGGIVVCTLALPGRDADAQGAFGQVPSLEALISARGGSALSTPLDQAYRAVAAVCAIDFMLLLPHLTAPSDIALWRFAASLAIKTPAMQDAASASDLTLVSGIDAASAVAPLAIGGDALLALNRFLARHYGWHR
jgi:hypothetical protein